MNRRPTASVARAQRGVALTIVELLVAMAVLVVLVALIAQLFTSAQRATDLEDKHMDADEQARALFDRMAIDFAQMVKREDVDYFIKSSEVGPTCPSQPQPGNDRIAFYSQVSGYSSSSSQSPISVVGYRINANHQLERLAYGLLWNGLPAADTPMIYSGTSVFSGPNNTIVTNWPATASADADPDHCELAGPDVFRMEYYYLLKGQTFSSGTFASQLSGTPWDARIKKIFGVADHTSINGMQDVAAIGVVLAVIDPTTRALVSNDQLTSLAGTMQDFSDSTATPGALEAQWQSAIQTSGIPHIAASSMRIYRRWFSLSAASNPMP